MTIVDPKAVEALMRQVADEEILPFFQRLEASDIQEKAPGDLVTKVDHASEARLTEALPRLLPGSQIVGEEAVAKDRSVLERLETDIPTWIVDPLDGTHNFSHGDRPFGMITALVQGGEILGGWIFDPLGDRFAYAGKGQGTFLNGARVPPCTGVETPGEMEIRATYGALVRRFGSDRADAFKAKIGAMRQVRCSAGDYLDLLSGKTHGIATMRTKPWDHAAGVLMHQERGGIARLIDGRSYRPVEEAETMLIVSSEALWQEFASVLSE